MHLYKQKPTVKNKAYDNATSDVFVNSQINLIVSRWNSEVDLCVIRGKNVWESVIIGCFKSFAREKCSTAFN